MTARVLVFLFVMGLVETRVATGDELEQAARDAVTTKRFRDAAVLYTRLSEREPVNADYLVWIGRLSSWMQEYQAALDAYDRALARAPQHVEALVGKASVLLWQQKFADAYRELLLAEQLAPTSTDVQLAFARYHHYQQQEDLAYARVRLALALEPTNDEARRFRSQIVVPRRIRARIGYGRDDVSVVAAGHMGYIAGGYFGARGHLELQYERWDKFGETVDRAGVSASGRWGDHVWLRGGAMFASEATVLAREEYSAGLSRSWGRGVVVGADYRRVELSDVRVHVASPGVEYYFARRPVWLQAVFSQSWTQFEGPARTQAQNQSFLVRYNQHIVLPVVVHLGYARGNESFAALSIDQVGRFRANTYSGGVDIRMRPGCSVAISYGYQQRSNGSYQRSVAIGVSLQE